MSAKVLRFTRSFQPPPVSFDELIATAELGRQLGLALDAGLIAPSGRVGSGGPEGPVLAKAGTAAQAKTWTWVPLRPALAVHQLPGWRPFHGVTWMLSPDERAAACLRRRRASRGWLKEIFGRG